MKRLVGLIVFVSLFAPVLGHADSPCGDEGLTCGEQERCCEHIVAIYAGENTSAPPYVQGACIAQEQKCSDFWCGNQQCKSGFFSDPSVCCINIPEGVGSREYACASSEYSCPGNSAKLTIRDTQPTRTLRRS